MLHYLIQEEVPDRPSENVCFVRVLEEEDDMWISQVKYLNHIQQSSPMVMYYLYVWDDGIWYKYDHPYDQWEPRNPHPQPSLDQTDPDKDPEF